MPAPTRSTSDSEFHPGSVNTRGTTCIIRGHDVACSSRPGGMRRARASGQRAGRRGRGGIVGEEALKVLERDAEARRRAADWMRRARSRLGCRRARRSQRECDPSRRGLLQIDGGRRALRARDYIPAGHGARMVARAHGRPIRAGRRPGALLARLGETARVAWPRSSAGPSGSELSHSVAPCTRSNRVIASAAIGTSRGRLRRAAAAAPRRRSGRPCRAGCSRRGWGTPARPSSAEPGRARRRRCSRRPGS
jgi:hypothetical protein